jgi:hypothetical protein
MTLALPAATAAVAEREAARRGKDLTPVGAERAGNSSGTIPEWRGGMTTPPASYQPGGTRIDPFANEQPLFTINANNYQQYADRLTEGQKALFQQYPSTFRMPVYQTHRTSAAPQWVYDQTRLNSSRAKLIADGNGVADAYGGYPFPIPQNGHQVIWNHLMRWQGEGTTKRYKNLTVFKNATQDWGETLAWETYPYHDIEGDLHSFKGNILQLMGVFTEPVRRKGEVLLVRESVNELTAPRQTWQYLPGQRRVRRAPTVAYDYPALAFSGQTTFDDTFMYNGSPDRFDWKLVGKQELYIPYNNNGLLAASEKGRDEIVKIATAHHLNPDYLRWELHRVWVVEATRKKGKRHIYGTRVFYIDEDSWTIAATDIYDNNTELWRVGFANLLNAYDLPGTIIRGTWHADLKERVYALHLLDIKPIEFHQGQDEGFYTPAQVRKLSRR